jgi:hypothetical protein
MEPDYSRVTWPILNLQVHELQQELKDLYLSYWLDFEEGMHLTCLS